MCEVREKLDVSDAYRCMSPCSSVHLWYVLSRIERCSLLWDYRVGSDDHFWTRT